MAKTPPIHVTAALWTLLGLFCLRVLGQLAVVIYAPSFLPPMDEWYSGLIPYGPLLVAQILIIGVYGKICIHFTRGSGFFVRPRPFFANGVRYFGYAYFAAMVFRYIIRMTIYPDERWFGGCIPIVFHWVLASFLIVFAHHHRSRLHSSGAPPTTLQTTSAD